MRTIEISVYSINELDAQSKENALKAVGNMDLDLSVYVHEVKEECELFLTSAGFLDPKVSFSISGSQGDGLNFSADGIKPAKLIKELNRLLPGKPKTAEVIAENLVLEYNGNDGRYTYAARDQVRVELDRYNYSSENLQDIVDQLYSRLADEYMALCAQLEEKVEERMLWLSSDEFMEEEAEALGLEFYEDGRVYEGGY